MPEATRQTTARLRRRRRLLVAAPAVLVTWSVLTGLPFAAAAPTAGTMETEIISLTGPDAVPTAPAGSDPDVVRNATPDEAAPGWSAAVEVDEGTQAVAASWVGEPEGAVTVRGRAADGWTEWATLESEPEEAPDDAPRSSGGMAWFGIDGVDLVEVRVDEGELADLELQTMRYEEPATSTLAPPTAGASTAQPTIQPRSSYTSKGWNSSNPGCSPAPVTATGGVRLVVIHHTVNSNTYAANDVPAMLAAIHAFHTGTNRWCDVGYNFIIDRFGRIWEGRTGGIDKAIVGGHAAGFNTGSVGISFLGQHEPTASPAAAQPSASSLDAAAKLVGWKLALHGVDPTGTTSFTSGGSNKWPAGTVLTLPRVIGHLDVGFTACPGANLQSKLGAMRTAAKAYQGTPTTPTTIAPPPTTAPAPPPEAIAPFATARWLVAQQFRDVLRREATAADLDYWGSRVGTSWTPARFVAHLITTSEADTRVHSVTRLYRAYFLRNPDHSGFTFWMNRRGEGRSLVSISQSFASSSEFRNRYGSLSNAAFVDRVYQNVMGRPADASGGTYWTNRLNAGVSRGQVMANFSQSTEYQRKTVEGVHVVAVYEAMVRRAVTADVFAWFVNGMRTSDTALSTVVGVVWDSAEYRARFS